MNTEAHLALGWMLAHAGGAESRRFRQLVVFSALASDLDVLTMIGGVQAYASYHHAIGHNVFFSVMISGICVLLSRHKPWKIVVFSQLGFYSHYFGDYFFTRFPLQYFWPVSYRAFIYSYRIGLDHPINLAFGYASFLILIVMAMKFKRTPIELFSIALDQRIINLFRRRSLICHQCGRGASETCRRCDRPVCIRHGKITRRFMVTCLECSIRPQANESTSPADDKSQYQPNRGES